MQDGEPGSKFKPLDKPTQDPGYSAMLSAMYEGIAAMLPVEGRDYTLNPSPNGMGGVHLEPEAYTKIGKIWLEYLAEALPQYSSMTKDEREMFLEKRNYGDEFQP